MRTTKIVLLTVALIVLIGVGFFLTNPQAGRQLLVELGLAAPVAQAYTASGMLEAALTRLGSETGGRLTDLPVAEGETVRQGQVVARLGTELLEVQREAARSHLDAALARLNMLEGGPRPVDRAVDQNAEPVP